MRLFEILFILGVLFSLIICTKKSKPQAFTVLLLILPLGLHLLLEGWRWQLVPAYILVPFLLWRLTSRTNMSKLGFAFCSIVSLISLVLGLFVPVPKHPELNGSYKVGVQLLDVNDVLNERTLPIKLWFPLSTETDTRALKPAPWVNRLDLMGPALAAGAALPSFTFNHLKHFQAGFEADIMSSVVNDKPLILLIHGRGGFKALNSFMAMELASQGYIVMAPEIPGGAMLSIEKDGTQVPFDPASFAEDKEYSQEDSLKIVRGLGQNWSKDMETSVRLIKEKFPQLTNKMIFSGGHSTGAAAAINFCNENLDCKGTIALDAWMKPVAQSILETGSTKPILALFGDQDSGDFEPINQKRFTQLKNSTEKNAIDIEYIEIKRARHIDFCDGALLSPYSYILGQQKGKIDAKEVMNKINQESLNFLSKLSKQ